jgi:hypothetical protein
MTPPNNAVLLVEGNADREVVYHLCNAHGIANQRLFDIQPQNGFDGVFAFLRLRPFDELRVLGVLVDADADIEARWRSLRTLLEGRGYSGIPPRPTVGGAILEGSTWLPRLGLWLMPDNRLPGLIEDFLTSIAVEDNDLLCHARSCVVDLPQPRCFKDVHEAKAILHTWLAWQEEPGTPMGLALTRRYLDPHHPQAAGFAAWLRLLFMDA